MKILKSILSCPPLLLIILFATVPIPVLADHAAVGEWVDHATIEVDGVFYHDDQSHDGDEGYINGKQGCDSEVENIQDGFRAAILRLQRNSTDPRVKKDCLETFHGVKLNHPANRDIQFVWASKTKIRTADTDQTDRSYVLNNARGAFFQEEDDACIDSFATNSIGNPSGTLIIRSPDYVDGNDDGTYTDGLDAKEVASTLYGGDDRFNKEAQFEAMKDLSGCGQIRVKNIRLGQTVNADDNKDNDLNTGGTELAPGSAEDQLKCDGGPGLGFIVCALVEFIQGVVDWVAKTVIVPFLEVSPVAQKDADGNNTDIYEIWKNIRTLANVLLVPVFIVIIYSQAIGGGGKE